MAPPLFYNWISVLTADNEGLSPGYDIKSNSVQSRTTILRFLVVRDSRPYLGGGHRSLRLASRLIPFSLSFVPISVLHLTAAVTHPSYATLTSASCSWQLPEYLFDQGCCPFGNPIATTGQPTISRLPSTPFHGGCGGHSISTHSQPGHHRDGSSGCFDEAVQLYTLAQKLECGLKSCPVL